jgi:hypothetical protein
MLRDTAIIAVHGCGWILSYAAFCAAEALLVTPDIAF